MLCKILLFLLVTRVCAQQSNIEFLTKLDFKIFDWITPQSLSFDIDISDEDYHGLLSIASRGVIRITEFKSGLHVIDCNNLDFDNEEVNFIKEPDLTFLLKCENFSLLKSLRIADQPYFYLWSHDGNSEQLFEVQSYLGHGLNKVLIAEWNKTESNEIHYGNIGLLERRRDLQGAVVRVAHEHRYPWFRFGPNNELLGFDGKLLQIFQETFNFTIQWVPLNGYGVELSNGSFTGAIGSLINNQMDFGPLRFSHTKSRISVVDPGFKFDQISFQLLHKVSSASNNKYSSLAIFGVFDAKLWTLWSFFTVFLGLVFMLSSRFWISPGKWSAWTPLKAICRSVIGYSIETDHLTTNTSNLNVSMHLQIFSFSLFFGLMFWTFAGSLTSFLVNNTQEPLLRTLDDLKLKSSDFKLFFEDGSAINGIILQWANESTTNFEAYKTLVEPYKYKHDDAAQVLQNQVMNSNQQAVILGAGPRIQWFVNQIPKKDQCDYAVGTLEGISTSAVGWMFPKNSILTPLFNKHMFELKKTGILDRLLTEHFKPIDLDCTSKLQFVEINFHMVQVLFMVLAVGAFTSLLVVLRERYLLQKPR